MGIELPVVAGGVSTVLFAASALPMLIKAGRTRDLRSYSLSNIVLSNVGNAVHSIYVFNLPAGPIWVLHTFYLTSTALMLVWYLRFAIGRRSRTTPSDGVSPSDRVSPSDGVGPYDGVSPSDGVGPSYGASGGSREGARARAGAGGRPRPRAATRRSRRGRQRATQHRSATAARVEAARATDPSPA
jgi:hypothetical protein